MATTNKNSTTIIIVTVIVAALIIAGFATHGFGVHHGSWFSGEEMMSEGGMK